MGFWNPIIRFFFFSRPNIYSFPQKVDVCFFLNVLNWTLLMLYCQSVAQAHYVMMRRMMIFIRSQVKAKKIIIITLQHVCLAHDSKKSEQNSFQVVHERPDLASVHSHLLIADAVKLYSFRVETSILWLDWIKGRCCISFVCSAETLSSRHFWWHVCTFLCFVFEKTSTKVWVVVVVVRKLQIIFVLR